MNIPRNLLATIFLLSASTLPAFAGSGVGNGGVSVVCRDNTKKIISAQLLDIYEGEVRYGKKYDNKLDVDTKIELAQLKLAKFPAFLSDFQEELSVVESMLKYVPIGNVLTSTNDAFPTILKKGCEFEQVANYTGDGDILVSKEIHKEFATIDRAALLVHETIYSLFRKAGATDSRQSRKLTAELLAKNPNQLVINQILGSFGDSETSEDTCGLKGPIQERIKNCNLTMGNFALVARTKNGKEIYKDLNSGKLWSDRLESSMDKNEAHRACRGQLEEFAGISNVQWRLPSLFEYTDAEKNGIRSSLPNMKSKFWLEQFIPRDPEHPNWVAIYDGISGYTFTTGTSYFSVRCVAY